MNRIGFKTEAVKLTSQQLELYQSQTEQQDPLAVAMQQKGLEEAINFVIHYLQADRPIAAQQLGNELRRIKERWFAPI